MKKVYYALVGAALLGLALAARAGDGPSYDGTGSIFIPTADNPYKPEEAAKAQAEADAQRQALAKAAAGRISRNLVDYAAVLEQGDPTHAPDRAAALDYYEKAAELGHVVGRQRIAIAYILGEGRPLDLKKGFDYADKLGPDDPVGLFSAGLDYEQGITGPKDPAMAVGAYVAAARVGSGEAADALGHIALAQGKPDVARGWYRQGVYLGSADAMDHLAGMMEAGQGAAADKAEAYWLYVNAARRGNVHAQAWVDALPPSTKPLARTALRGKNKEISITRTYGQPGHTKTESLNPSGLAAALTGAFPAMAGDREVNGQATIHCYIDADHQIDACLIEDEFPLGYGFGRVLGQVYDGHYTVSEQDAEGRPTANTVFVLRLRWQIS